MLDNETGFDIAGIYISPSDDDKWRLVRGDHALANGSHTVLRFSDFADARYWDLKVVYGNGRSYSWRGLDLLNTTLVQLRFRNGRIVADVSQGLKRLL